MNFDDQNNMISRAALPEICLVVPALPLPNAMKWMVFLKRPLFLVGIYNQQFQGGHYFNGLWLAGLLCVFLLSMGWCFWIGFPIFIEEFSKSLLEWSIGPKIGTPSKTPYLRLTHYPTWWVKNKILADWKKNPYDSFILISPFSAWQPLGKTLLKVKLSVGYISVKECTGGTAHKIPLNSKERSGKGIRRSSKMCQVKAL